MLLEFLGSNITKLKKQVTTIIYVTKPLDRTLEAFQNVEDAIIDIKTQKNVMTDKIMVADYDKILVQLEKASESLINAIVIFQRYEKSL